MEFRLTFQIISIIVTIINITIGVLAILKKDKKGKFLALTCFTGVIVDIFYTISACTQNAQLASIFSSLYFIFIDLLLLAFLGFNVNYGKPNKLSKLKVLCYVLIAYWFVEIAIFIVNIFNPIVVSYTYRESAQFMWFTYNLKPLYWAHLSYTYLLVVLVIATLIYKFITIPSKYRMPLQFIFYALMLTVILNAVFLFIPKNGPWTYADYSIFFYCFGTTVCYWASYVYPKNGMLSYFKTYILRAIGQGIILFDYEDKMLISNEKALKFFSFAGVNQRTTLNEFIERTSISVDIEQEAYSLQCYCKEFGKQKPLRCDYRKLRDDNGIVVGRLFVFQDAQLDTDLLTGFHNWDSFSKFAKENGRKFPDPTTVAVCDINRLSLYNTVHGRNKGDTLLKELAEKMRKIFPEDAYYVRGQDAYLISVCYNKNEDDVKKYLVQLSSEFKEKVQFSLSQSQDTDENLVTIMIRAFNGLKAKKLLDEDSVRSSLISSLVKAIKENDPDCESHSLRVQKMANDLGKRIGLSDTELSRLSLLGLLHDIGKIGVPLEIVNKPGKLNDEEWLLIKSHSTKGEAIANSTPELQCIAKEIRSHHERWDGKGYPDGLSRETIPFLSRIIAVVDAFDAMVSHRPYRKAKSVIEARDELIHCAGSQFDPYLASEFVRMLDEGYQVITNSEDIIVPTVKIEESNEPSNNFANIHPVSYSKYTLNSEMRIIKIDNAFTELTGYTEDDINNNVIHQSDLLPKEDRKDYVIEVEKQLSHNSLAYIEHRILCKDGNIRYVYCLGKKYFDSAAHEEKSEIIVTNSTTTYSAQMLANNLEVKAQKQLKSWEETYRKDSLTGLLNHMAFVNDLEQSIISNPDLDYMLILIDIDNFKRFNDTYGHHAGDEFLVVVSQAILSSISKGSFASRLGGDEFMMAVFFDKDKDYKRIAKGIFDKISMRLSALEKSTTFSMGVSKKSDKFHSFNEHYEAVDKILYKSKDLGKNIISFYEEDEVKKEDEA